MSAPAFNAQPPVAVITGCSSGFGQLIALELAKNGFIVYATMRQLSAFPDLARLASIQNVSERILPMQLDVTDKSSILHAIEAIITNQGRIDLLVNNAGFAKGGFIEDVPIRAWREQMETNFFGVLAMTKAVVPYMRKRRSGRIINISSVSGLIAFPGYAPYAASKYAVEGLSESLRHELRPYQVDVVLVEPASFRTSIWEKGLQGMEDGPVASPYSDMLATVREYSQQTAKTAPPPQQVADLIVKIARAKRTRLRYPVGKGARLIAYGKPLLPWRWLESIVARALVRFPRK